MPWDCPKCGLVNPLESRFCDCTFRELPMRIEDKYTSLMIAHAGAHHQRRAATSWPTRHQGGKRGHS
jgi:hypothetical protein